MRRMLDKLLSHRVRGFGAPEHSAAALRAATRSPIPWLEIDTRASADGALFVHHDPVTAKQRLRFSRSTAQELASEADASGDPLLRLEDALRIFAGRTHREQRLCLDIKDHGFEDEHLRAVRSAGVESHTCFISWIPQTLSRLRALDTSAPLFLSHANLLQYPLLALLSRPWRRSVRRLGQFVLMGHERHEDELEGLRHGYQHSLVCDRLPRPLLDTLAASGGGICVHYALAGARLGGFCREHGLRLWVFTARNAGHFRRLAARPDVDVVFSDEAAAVSGMYLATRPSPATHHTRSTGTRP